MAVSLGFALLGLLLQQLHAGLWKAAQVMEHGFGAASPGCPRLECFCEHLMLFSSQVPGSTKDSEPAPAEQFGELLCCIFWENYRLSSSALAW